MSTSKPVTNSRHTEEEKTSEVLDLTLRERQLLLLIDKKDDLSKKLFKKLADKKTLQTLINKGLICETGTCDSCNTLKDEVLQSSKSAVKNTKDNTSKSAENKSKKLKSEKPKPALSLSDFAIIDTAAVVKNIMLISLKSSQHEKADKLKQKIKKAEALTELSKLFPKWEKLIKESSDSPDIDTWISQVENHLINL